MKVWSKQKKGFSLIELLIVVAIIGIAASLSWKTLSDSKKRTQVANACETVAALSNKARAYALSGINDANRVRVRCVSNECRIQRCYESAGGNSCNNNTTAAWDANGWSNTSDASPSLQGVAIGDFSVRFAIPYASGGSGVSRADPVITSSSDHSITKTLNNSAFKASCQ